MRLIMPVVRTRSAKTGMRWLMVSAMTAGFVFVGGAQTRNAQDPAVPAETGQADQTPIYRAGVTLVTTDAIVRDGNGLFISDLTAEDFLVEEDGVAQEVVSLVLVNGGRVFNQLAPQAPVQEGIILPASRPVNSAPGRIVVLFVDDLHLQWAYTPRVRQVFRTIADTLIHEGDLFGVISSGPSSLSIDLTYDRSILRDVENRIIGNGFSPRELITALNQGASGSSSELLYRQQVAMKTARETVGNLGQVQDRRKVFIYLSSGYDLNPFSERRGVGAGSYLAQDFSANVNYQNDPFEVDAQRGHVFADTDMFNMVAELTQAANRANTSFYTVDPRGLVAGADLDSQVGVEAFNRYLFKTQSTLRMLAELTGGMAIVNRNDFEESMQEIDASTSDYYVVGFYTSNPDPTRRTRSLDVRVNRPDVTVQARTSYTFPRTTTR